MGTTISRYICPIYLIYDDEDDYESNIDNEKTQINRNKEPTMYVIERDEISPLMHVNILSPNQNPLNIAVRQEYPN